VDSSRHLYPGSVTNGGILDLLPHFDWAAGDDRISLGDVPAAAALIKGLEQLLLLIDCEHAEMLAQGGERRTVNEFSRCGGNK